MKQLKTIKKKTDGRNNAGQVVVRHKGGAHKRFLRTIDFKRDKLDVVGTVVSIEYDPNRSADIALIHYADGDKRYVLAPNGMKVKDTLSAGSTIDIKSGNALPLMSIPVGTVVHNIELTPGRGGQMARS